MSKNITFKFEDSQSHQKKGIESIVGVFEGMQPVDDSFRMVGDDSVANMPEYMTLEENWLLGNVKAVQDANGIQEAMFLDFDNDETMLEGISLDTWRYQQFTIEMETGTGKTYVYLRSIFELRKRYGFRKFIIVVPSIAIYEGTVKGIEMTRSHFQSLYDNERLHVTKYDGQQLSKLRNFANSSFTEVMVITLDAFNKASNKIYNPTEKLPGEKLPIQYIQETRPILILDESQNYLSKKAKQSLRMLKPLVGFCFSATPKEKPNLLYRLGPVEAFKQNLVKKIEVLGVNEDNINNPQLQLALESIGEGYTPTARVKVMKYEGGKFERSVIEIKKNDNLFDKTHNDAHRGLVVEEINRQANTITFTNQEVLGVNESDNPTRNEIFKVQIEETVKFHLHKQNELQKKGIKVLSLFFIDRVVNYTADDGIIEKLFEEAIEKLKSSYEFSKGWKAADVHRGYFAKKQNKKGEVEYLNTHIDYEDKTKDEKEQEKDAYRLIMREKERLLNFDEKVCFIFAHSALKEGWDNPNVFQICTLNQTTSEAKKRQEIGRGLRICVNQQGERVMDETVNVLTVVANENYESYVNGLQKEYNETGDTQMAPPSRARKYIAQRNDKIYKSKAFKDFWNKLCKRTTYNITLDKEKLVEQSIHKLNGLQVAEPKITITRGKFIMTEFKLELLEVQVGLPKIRVSITDTDGSSKVTENRFGKGVDIAKLSKDDRLKGFKVVEVEGNGDDAIVHFGDKGTLTKHQPITFHSERGQQTAPRVVSEAELFYPVFNLIERTAKETQLTRNTVLEIFKGMREDKSNNVLKNPEGFAEAFIKEIKSSLADNVAERIEYYLTDEAEEYEMDEVFPSTKHYPQKEVLEGTKSSLYDVVQIDSEVEKRFVEFRLQDDDKNGNVALYFKFPNSFKISMPKLIQNYIPDWGVVRFTEEKGTIQLVRETKGSAKLETLRFPNEVRKIRCAQKHFKALGINYRPVDDTIPKWWESDPIP